MAAKIWCLFLCCATALGFNVDIPSRVVHRGTSNSMFGFSVQAHVDGDQKMVLVGAPEADTRRFTDVTRPGAVFRCEPGAPGRCRELVFDRSTGNNVDKSNRQIDQKSNQWFGATLTSTGVNGPIVACAPRYVSYVSAKQNQRDPVGSCFVARSSAASDVNEFSPCRTWFRSMDEASHGQRKTGVCQAGFGAAISKDGQRLFLGAPGSFYWQGRTFSIDSNERFLYFMPKIPEEGQLHSQSLERNLILTSTPEASPKYDDSYMGYSVATGDFAGQGMQGVAVGVPRGQDLRGLVVLYTWDLQNIRNISGPQIGAYFGYSLASGDIDGDGFDDVIVGSPMFTRTKVEGYEHGRVYVIYQGRDQAYEKSHWRNGEVSKGRFGLSVASLGDINLDGFGDIAVGAPYGGAEGRGVVYIYHGSELGLRKQHSQLITAEEVSTGPPFLSTFGFSLSGGIDLDGNNYTDLVVGAYKSDSAVYFRSRPVVKVMAEVRFMGDTKLISLTEKKCKLADGTEVVCAQLMFCLTYDGINVNKQINFRVTLDLDSKQKSSKRLFLLETRQTTYSEDIYLAQGRQECRDQTVFLDEDIRDKLTPIEVAMTYELVTQYSGDVIPPVLDQTKTNVYTDSLNIQKNCGPDNVCIPDLRMAATTPNFNYVLGSSENVNIDVSVDNSGEDAFEAAYYLQIPAGVTYAKMERLDKDVEDAVPIYCSISNKEPKGNSTLKCDLGNPMASGQAVKFRVILEVDAQVQSLDFHMVANSTNPERDSDYDNEQPLHIGVVIKAHLSIIGTSDPPELHYNASLYARGDEQVTEDIRLGPQLIHKYNIKNEGPFAVEAAELYIMWPYQTHTGENLMYMLVQPEWIGDMQCDVARHVNPDNMFVHNPYNSPLVKERQAMANSEFYHGIQISRGGGYYGQTYLEQGSNSQNVASGNQFAAGSSQFGGSSHHYASGSNQFASGGNNYAAGSGSQFAGSGNQYSGNTNQFASGGANYAGSQSGGARTQYSTSQTANRNQFASSGSQNYGSGSRSYGEGSQSYAGGAQSYGSQSYGAGSQSYGSGQANVAGSQSYGSRGQVYGSGSQGSRRDEYGQGFSHEEEEAIRRNLATAVANANVAGQGNSQGVTGSTITRAWNKTVMYDASGNVISETETSTEYGSLGREGEAGSSFRNRFGADVSRQSHGGAAAAASGRSSQGQWSHSYASNHAAPGQTWSTEESVNRDVMKAGSTYQRGGSKVTYVGEEDDEIGGFGAYAAQGSNNEFKYGVADVSGASTHGGSGSGSGVGYSSGGGYREGAAGGGVRQSAGSTYSSGGGGGGYSYSSSSRSGGSYSAHAESGYGTAQSRRESTRRRRDDAVDPQLKLMLERCEEKYRCEVIRCTTGRLLKGQEIWLALRSRINASVMYEISKEKTVKLSTLATTRVTKLPIVDKPSDQSWQTAEAQTLVTPQLEALSSGYIPYWVIILAAVVGALLLLLLIFALYKCGFFKRNRPSDHTERQPLNGRDEHL
ncbi:integrin alpha-PS2 isoform X1 [Plutella xylostella]|uniref:integrin alpha-PS2 isoform X1 n=1 Tax=Plutella xylostella TaxID=51655 RepID=UPI0020323E76|nr:integrin alpha-PS2 isoform X1 [Plutella xylostella]